MNDIKALRSRDNNAGSNPAETFYSEDSNEVQSPAERLVVFASRWSQWSMCGPPSVVAMVDVSTRNGMSRPSSHREQVPDKRCGNCMFSSFIAVKGHLLCFHGDDIEHVGTSNYPVEADYINLNGESVNFMEGDEFDRVWGKCVVDSTDVCDEWREGSICQKI